MSIRSVVLNFLLSFSLACISFYLAWQASAATNFFYSLWYEVIEIDQTIQAYGPKNKNKQGFALTSKPQQVELFSGIVSSIQDKGKGLKDLEYTSPDGKFLDTLLTDAEIIHLQDVANLVSRFKYLAIGGGVIFLITLVLMNLINVKLATIKTHILGGIGLITVLVIAILIVGPTKVFYTGHELIFPNNHQWFFYYEDSLMSTMMKAPMLFGPIACQLLLTTIILWMLSLFILSKFNASEKI